jgi:hypothetical protein
MLLIGLPSHVVYISAHLILLCLIILISQIYPGHTDLKLYCRRCISILSFHLYRSLPSSFSPSASFVKSFEYLFFPVYVTCPFPLFYFDLIMLIASKFNEEYKLLTCALKTFCYLFAVSTLSDPQILLNILFSDILSLLGYHGENYDSLLGCDARESGKCLLMFQRNILYPSSG